MAIDFTCPNCNREFKLETTKIGSGKYKTCPNPKCKAKLSMDPKTKREFEKLDKSIKNLLKKRTIKINI